MLLCCRLRMGIPERSQARAPQRAHPHTCTTYHTRTRKHAHMASHVCVGRPQHTLMCAWRPGQEAPCPPPAGRWEWLASGGGLDPLGQEGGGPVCRAVLWVLSPHAPPSLVLVSCCWCCLGPHRWFPCDNLGHLHSLTLPLPWEKPHTHRTLHTPASQIAPCGNSVLCSDKLGVHDAWTFKSIQEQRVSFSVPECSMQPGSSCPGIHRYIGTGAGVHARRPSDGARLGAPIPGAREGH